MIKQLKLGFQMMQYAYAVKISTVCEVLLFLFGMVLLLLWNPSMIGMGIYFLALGSLFPQQFIYSLAASNMVGSSGWKRRMETSIPALTGFVTALLTYLLVLGISALRISAHPEAGQSITLTVVLCAEIMCAVMIYGGIAYKFFVAATIAFFAVVWGSVLPVKLFQYGGSELHLSFGAAAVIGFALLILGGLVQYGIACLVYRVPISKQSQLRGLRKWM